MKPNPNWPDVVFRSAHQDFPNAVGAKGLYCMAFFGHGRPSGLTHKETPESVWRGLCRKHLRALAETDGD